MAFHHGPNLGGTELTHYWDAGLIGSYPKSGSNWYDLLNPEITGSVSESDWESRRSFKLEDSNFALNGNPFNFKLSDEKTFNFFFTPHDSGSYLFNIKNIFRIWLCDNKQLSVILHQTNDLWRGYDLTVDDLGIWYYRGDNSNYYEIAQYDKDFNLKETRFHHQYPSTNWFRQGYNQQAQAAWHDENLIVHSLYNGYSLATQSEFPIYGVKETNYGFGPNWCRGLAIDDTYVYLSDDTNNKFSKYDRATQTEATYSSINSVTPSQVTIDDDWFYTGDESSDEVQKRYKSDLIITQSIRIENPHGMAQDTDYIYSVSRTNGTIYKIAKDTFTIAASTGSLSSRTDGCAVSGGLVYTIDYNNNRILVCNTSDMSFNTQFDMTDSSESNYEHDRYWYAVKCGFISSSDAGNHLYTFGRQSNTRKHLIASGGNTGQFDNLYPAVTLGSDSYGACFDGTHAYLGNNDQDEVNKYLVPDWGTRVDYFGDLPGSGVDEVNQPRGTAVSGSLLFVADNLNHRIKVLNKSDMTYLTQSESPGGEYMTNPFGLKISGSSLYIACTQGIIEVEATPTMSFNGKTASTTTWEVEADDDYIYGGYSGTVRKYNKSDYSLERTVTLLNSAPNQYAEHPDHHRHTGYGLILHEDYLWIATSYSVQVRDKEHLGWVNELNQFTNVATTFKKVVIDEFTNLAITCGADLALKLYLNGEYVGEKKFNTDAEFRTAVDAVSGIFDTRQLQYKLDIDWHAIMIHDTTMTEQQINETYLGMRERFAR